MPASPEGRRAPAFDRLAKTAGRYEVTMVTRLVHGERLKLDVLLTRRKVASRFALRDLR